MVQEPVIALNAQVLNESQIILYIKNFVDLFGTTGSKSNFSKQLTLKASDGLRIWLGIPQAEMTVANRRLFEAVYAYTFNTPMPDKEIWVEEPNWHPINPRSRGLSEQTRLDLEFCDYLGPHRALWENEILFVPLQNASSSNLSPKQFRLFSALAYFGFPDPHQFFR